MDALGDFEQAEALFRRGDLSGALALARAGARTRPDHAGFAYLLGATLCHMGDLAAGIPPLRRSLELAPEDSEARIALAHALAATGRGPEALELTAGEPRLLRLRAYLLQAAGAPREASKAYEAIVAEEPGDAEAWNNLGNARRAAGNAAGAIQALERARRLRPDLAPIHLNIGQLRIETGDLPAAEAAFREALRLDPRNAPAWLTLGRLLRYIGREEDALEAFAGARQADPRSAEPALEQARSLTSLRRLAEAESLYRQALSLEPGLADAWLELGIVLERDNRTDALEALLQDASKAGVPSEALLYLKALWLRRAGRLEEALAAAQAAPPEVEPVRRWALIGRVADRLDRHDLAFAAYRRMNEAAAARASGSFDAAAYRRHLEALTQRVTRQWFESWSPPAPPGERPAPIFLVGFPRSGTTLLDTMLMGHPRLAVLEEEPLLQKVEDALGGYDRLTSLEVAEMEKLRRIYFEGLDALPIPQGRLVVDKLPLNILGAPLIHRLFPDAHFIFAQRHPCDVVLSGFMQDFELNDAMANFLSLEDAASLYDLVLGFWTRCLQVLPLKVATVRYETLVADPETALRPAIQFLGLEWDEALLDHRGTAARRGTIITPSYSQVVEPLYAQASGRWQRYGAQMAPVLPRLAPWIERLGYPPVDLPA